MLYFYDKIKQHFKSLEIKLMAIQDTLNALIAAVKTNNDLSASVDQTTTAILTEVQGLVAAAGVTVPGLDELIATVVANNAALTHAIATGTAIEALVPAPTPAPPTPTPVP